MIGPGPAAYGGTVIGQNACFSGSDTGTNFMISESRLSSKSFSKKFVPQGTFKSQNQTFNKASRSAMQKVFLKQLECQLVGTQVDVGPADYTVLKNSFSANKSRMYKEQPSFSKAARNLDLGTRDSHGSYESAENQRSESPHEQKLKILGKTSPSKGNGWKTRGSFTQEKRRLDISKIGQINQVLWAKGLK